MNRSVRLRTSALVAAAALGLASCSASTDSSDEGAVDDGGSGQSGELVIQSTWTRGSPEGDVLEDVIARFEEESSATVEWLDTGASLSDVYESSVIAGDEADIVRRPQAHPLWAGRPDR